MVGSVRIDADVGPDVAVNPTPVSVTPVAVRAVIACTPGPARPVPGGGTWVLAVPPPAPAGERPYPGVRPPRAAVGSGRVDAAARAGGRGGGDGGARAACGRQR